MPIHLFKLALLVGALALSACAGGPFGRGPGDGPTGGAPLGTVPTAGGPSDPRSVAYFQSTVGDRVLFSVDQATLTPEARGTLSGQARWLAENTDYAAIIEGHADEQGTREYNIALGERRANAVEEFLIANGVADSRLRIVSYGKERPAATCSEERCYAQNRRAVTVLRAGGGAGF